MIRENGDLWRSQTLERQNVSLCLSILTNEVLQRQPNYMGHWYNPKALNKSAHKTIHDAGCMSLPCLFINGAHRFIHSARCASLPCFLFMVHIDLFIVHGVHRYPACYSWCTSIPFLSSSNMSRTLQSPHIFKRLSALGSSNIQWPASFADMVSIIARVVNGV